jgi:hypothetical protein
VTNGWPVGTGRAEHPMVCRSLATVLDPGLDYINGARTIPPTR